MKNIKQLRLAFFLNTFFLQKIIDSILNNLFRKFSKNSLSFNSRSAHKQLTYIQAPTNAY